MKKSRLSISVCVVVALAGWMGMEGISSAADLASNSIQALSMDLEGNLLWIGTAEGLSQYSTTQGAQTPSYTNFTVDDGLADNFVTALLLGRNGDLWIGTDNGLSRYHSETGFTGFSEDQGPVGSWVQAILEDEQGHIWVGTTDGLSRYDGESWKTVLHLDVQALALDSTGVLWAGTYLDGIHRYSLENETWEAPLNASNSGLSGDDVRAIVQDGEGVVWVGTSDGLSRYNGQEQRFDDPFADELAGRSVWALFVDSGGDLWIGTDGGLDRYRVQTQSLEKYTREAGNLLHNEVWAIAEAPAIEKQDNHDLYIGTSAGVSVFRRHPLFPDVWRTVTALTVPNPGIISTSLGGGTGPARTELAGGFSGDGGPMQGALLRAPRGVIEDDGKNLYILDTGNNRVRWVDTQADTITTIAGSGPPVMGGFSGDDGPATEALLNSPRGFFVDSGGNLYIADTANHRIRKVDARTKTITTVAGSDSSGFSGDDRPAKEARLNSPRGVCVDEATGDIYIADTGNHRIRKVDARTKTITTVVGDGRAAFSGDNGDPISASLNSPSGVFVLADKAAFLNIFIADTDNHRVRWVLLGTIQTLAGGGSAAEGALGDGGAGVHARLSHPEGVFVLSEDGDMNEILIADTGNNRIRKLDVLTGIISTVAGGGSILQPDLGDDDSPLRARLDSPTGIFARRRFGDDYRLLLADTGNHRIREIRFEDAGGRADVGLPGYGPALPGLGPSQVQAVSTPSSALQDSGTIQTLAGGDVGDGRSATQASLQMPGHAIADRDGNLFIADNGNFRVRRVDAVTGIIGTVAGTGVEGHSGDGGPATEARIGRIRRMVLDGSGNLYLADFRHNVIRKVTPEGIITTFVSGIGTPRGLAVDRQGNLFIADHGKDRIHVVDAGKRTLRTVKDSISSPNGIALSRSGDLLVISNYPSEGYNEEVIYRIDAGTEKENLVSFVGLTRGGMVVSPEGNIILGYGDHVLQYLPHSGSLEPFVGNGSAGFSGDGGPALLARTDAGLGGIALDSEGNLLIADERNHRIRRVDRRTGTIATVAGGSVNDGLPAAQAYLNLPEQIAVDSEGNVFIAEAGLHRIRKIDTSGHISTVAGTAGEGGFSGEGGRAAEAKLNGPGGVAVDRNGNLYIADTGNHRIRKVDTKGIIRTVAGRREADFSGDGGPATEAHLNGPKRIAVDVQGNLYFSDQGNNRVRRVAGQVINTVAGDEMEVGLNAPSGIFVDGQGHLYIADQGNHRVLKMDLDTGAIGVYAGNGRGGFAGDGGPATGASLYFPDGVCVDGAGNLFVVDAWNHRVRKVDAGGAITTVAGSDSSGFSGDGGLATRAALKFPSSAVVTASGDLVVSDTANGRIRRVTGAAVEVEPSTEKIPADFNGDGTVGFADWIQFTRHFGKKKDGEGYNAGFDLVEDGRIDFADLLEFVRYMGEGERLEKPIALSPVHGSGDAAVVLAPVASGAEDRVEVAVRLKHPVEMVGYSLHVAFEARALELTEARSAQASVFSEAPHPVPLRVSPAAGLEILADGFRDGSSVQGELVRLTFRVLDGAAPGRVEINRLLISDGAGGIVALPGAALADARTLPAAYSVSQNTPNPFNPETQIAYELPEPGEVSLIVYNLLGQQVRVLAQGRREPGAYRVTWDGRDDAGRAVSSGVYLYRFVSRGLRETRRMLLLK